MSSQSISHTNSQILRTVFFIMLFLIQTVGFTQEVDLDEQIRIEILESRVKHFYGIEKFDALLDLSAHYTKVNGRKATRYARQAVMLADEILIDELGQSRSDSTNRLPACYIQLGKAYYYYNKYMDAKETFDLAHRKSQGYNIPLQATQ